MQNSEICLVKHKSIIKNVYFTFGKQQDNGNMWLKVLNLKIFIEIKFSLVFWLLKFFC